MLLKCHYEPDSLKEWLETRDAEIEPNVAGEAQAKAHVAQQDGS